MDYKKIVRGARPMPKPSAISCFLSPEEKERWIAARDEIQRPNQIGKPMFPVSTNDLLRSIVVAFLDDFDANRQVYLSEEFWDASLSETVNS